jgi:3-oxoacyl-[acyl-carrier protein] reductase
VSKLNGRRALITGSLERTGLGIAQRLATDGAEIILHGRSDDGRSQAAQQHIAEACGSLPQVLYGDITDAAVCAKLADQTQDVSILVNNVGVYRPTDLAKTTAEHWRWTLAGNLDATFYMSQAFLPQLLASERGRLIQIGYVTCDQLRGTGHATAYQIAKTGVHLLSQSYAQRFAHRGLTANTVSPGQLENSVDLAQAGILPTGRAAEVAEVAAAVAFLSGADADYITGANINVAGGWEPRGRSYED